ncbi:MAG: MotA/TolQ/ExbB proton channel family protein [Methanosarcinales archaeon]|nr:MAG: MotA/TolQ/ExbB proton channel family protein [Methanosarcinales archaeon]
MDISSGIFGTMFMISNSLLYPVVLVLLGLIAWSFISVGQFVSEYTSRRLDSRRLKTNCRDAKSKIEKEDLNGAASALTGSGSNDLLQRFTKDISEILNVENFPVEAEKLLQDYELTISGELMQSRLVSRVGPMLGLMGTLIPMGPALIGLSSGNIQQLAENLVIAFATTVLGLLAGGVAYSILLIKKKWYTQDLSDMEYVVEVLK